LYAAAWPEYSARASCRPRRTRKGETAEATWKAQQLPDNHIALIVEIAPRTLRKHFRKELDRGMAEANAKVLQTLFGMATSGRNTAATIFWSKTRCGLRERREADEHSVMAPPAVLVQIEEPGK